MIRTLRWLVFLSAACAQQKQYDGAISQLQKVPESKHGSAGLLGYVYAVADRKDHSEDIFRKLQEQSKREYMPSSYLAMIYMGLGKKDCALPLLEKGYEEHDQGVNLLWDSLRSDPRYGDLLRRMGLPQ